MTATRIFIVSSRLTPTERAVAEELMAAQLDRHLDDRARYLSPNPNAAIAAGLAQDSGASLHAGDGNMVDAGQTTGPADPALSPDADHCPGCGAAEFGPESDRVVIDWSSGAGVVEPCSVCRPVEHASFKKRQAEVDPWDLASEELNLTCPLPRETPAYYGRSRDEYDANDDRADLQPFERTTK